MPKIKTKRSAAKRFKKTGTGQFKRIQKSYLREEDAETPASVA